MLLARQAAWQRSRAEQSWAEKLRMAILMREDLKSIRKSRSRDEEQQRKGADDYPPEHR